MYRVLFLFCLGLGVLANDENSPRILIIGAGSSGIAAASKLVENGFENLVILEAENRTGGRVYTTDLNGCEVDLGAQWVDGEVGNPVFRISNPLGLIAPSGKHALIVDMYTSPGELLDHELVNDIRGFYLNLTEDPSPYTDRRNDSIGEFIEEKFKVYFEAHPEINETMQKDLLWFFSLYQTGTDASDSWYDVSAKQYSEYHISQGDSMISWKDRGFNTILDVLMKKIPNPEEELPVEDKIVFNAEVTKIDYSDEDGPVKVTTADGTEYLADHVIVTVSLGVLKADHETLFEPPLPESKVDTIKGLGFGAAAKIWLAFEDAWWEEKMGHIGSISFLWSEEDRTKYWNSVDEKWIPSITAVLLDDFRPHSLQIWVSGEGARFADTVPDDLLFNQTMQILNKFLSDDYNISSPVAMLRSQWTINKHFRGVYSFNSMDTEKMNITRQPLAEPIMKQEKPVILFAGEATSLHFFATVHGAIATGWREAQRLINIYKKNDNDNDKDGS